MFTTQQDKLNQKIDNCFDRFFQEYLDDLRHGHDKALVHYTVSWKETMTRSPTSETSIKIINSFAEV